MNEYEELTNSELVKKCNELGIEVEAKNPKKPNKTELITAIEKFEKTEGYTAEQLDAEVEEISEEEFAELGTPEPVTEEPTKRKRPSKKELIAKSTKLCRVLVTDNSDNQTKTDVLHVTWGNDLIGHKTDTVLLGRNWHIRQGALNNLKEAELMKSVPNADTGAPELVVVPAYNIVEMPMLSLEEYSEMGEKQKIRNSAVSALAQ